MAPKYKITYFNARGAAEPVRIMFAIAGVEYEDERVTREGWLAIKADQPFGQVPVLRVDEKPLPCSKAIYRYIARELGFNGTTSWEAASIDVVTEVCDELSAEIFQLYKLSQKDPSKKDEHLKKLAEEDVPRVFANLEKSLKWNNDGNGWFVGDKLSLADIMVWTIYERTSQYIPNVDSDGFPKLQGFIERFKNDKKVAEWLAKRPVTEN